MLEQTGFSLCIDCGKRLTNKRRNRCRNCYILSLGLPEERFWSRVNKDTISGCWEWTASLNRNGYGEFRFEGRNQVAHRVAWKIANGEIPDGLFICHHCDNPKCVRLDHLFLGTKSENMLDCARKGRNASQKDQGKAKESLLYAHSFQWGEKASRSKLKNEQVLEIVQLNKSGLSRSEIARRFYVNKSTVERILRGETWQQLTGIYRTAHRCGIFART